MTAGSTAKLGPGVLDLDPAAETEFICTRIREILSQQLKRRGLVLGVSGGVDSSVCLALAARAVSPNKVLALLMPERESSTASVELGKLVAEKVGVPWQIEDITPALEGLGCYRQRDEAIRKVFPEYGEGWKNKIVIAGGAQGGVNFFKLVVRSPAGEMREQRVPIGPYLQIVAAQNYKQRTRKTVEFFHADRLNYAVVGTPNRLEYDQGFFVKNGDGSADVKPIAHLYKTQVYARPAPRAPPDAATGPGTGRCSAWNGAPSPPCCPLSCPLACPPSCRHQLEAINRRAR
jgi:NAD+ synthase